MNDFNLGHRKRLRERFLENGINSLHDYEIVELLLTFSNPRKDCKNLAKLILQNKKSLLELFQTDINDLLKIDGVGPNNIISLKLFKELLEILSKNNLERNENILNNPKLIFEYLKERIGSKDKEYLVTLFLDIKNNLIIEDVSIGIINASLVHPREVFNKAIFHKASSIILAHNHPSGDIRPSDADKETTIRIKKAGDIIGIRLLDHMIITSSNYYSFRSQNPEFFN